MKKAFFFVLILMSISFAFAACFNNGNNDNLKINKNDIDRRLLYNKITNSVNREYLREVFADDFETQYQSVAKSENTDEIENSLIKDIAIVEYCKEKRISIDKDSAAKTAKLEFENLNSDNSQNLYASFLKNTLSEYELSETDYIDLLSENAYYMYNRQVLKEYFRKNHYKEIETKSLEEQFNAYVERLAGQLRDGSLVENEAD